MNKKKILWGIVIFSLLAIIVWNAVPYLFSSKNLISRNNYDYSYRQAKLLDLDNSKNSICIDNAKSGKVDKLIRVVDGLSLKKAMKPSDEFNYTLCFVATYKKGKLSTYTEEVFSIRFYKNNVIAFQTDPQYKERYYKIQNKEFDIKKIIKELQENK